jgi:hypothetical protein
MGRTPPHLVINPSDDVAFRDAVEGALMTGDGTPERLEAALRERFPRAIVRPRGLQGEPVNIWYVYRDGHWVRRSNRREGY